MILESHLLQFCRHSLEKNWILYWILHAGALLRCVYHMHSVGMKQNISVSFHCRFVFRLNCCKNVVPEEVVLLFVMAAQHLLKQDVLLAQVIQNQDSDK